MTLPGPTEDEIAALAVEVNRTQFLLYAKARPEAEAYEAARDALRRALAAQQAADDRLSMVTRRPYPPVFATYEQGVPLASVAPVRTPRSPQAPSHRRRSGWLRRFRG